MRTRSVGTKVTSAEFEALESRARAQGLTLSEWVRAELLSEPPEAGVESGVEVMLSEFLALRTILINSLFTIAQDERPTPDAMQKLIDHADADKDRRARERLRGQRKALEKAAAE